MTLVQLRRAGCELCGERLAGAHGHVLDTARRQVLCACAACGLLFDKPAAGRYRRITPRVERLRDFAATESRWRALNVPVRLVFFRRSAQGDVLAAYPGPAGAVEAIVAAPAWDEIVAANQAIQDLTPDVEALLVNRLDAEARIYRVSIDHCYRLTGVIRRDWRGWTGGNKVARTIREFFDELECAG